MAASSGKNTRGSKGRASFAQRRVRYSWRNRLKNLADSLKRLVETTSMTPQAAQVEMSKVYGQMRSDYFQGRRKWRG